MHCSLSTLVKWGLLFVTLRNVSATSAATLFLSLLVSPPWCPSPATTKQTSKHCLLPSSSCTTALWIGPHSHHFCPSTRHSNPRSCRPHFSGHLPDLSQCVWAGWLTGGRASWDLAGHPHTPLKPKACSCAPLCVTSYLLWVYSSPGLCSISKKVIISTL